MNDDGKRIYIYIYIYYIYRLKPLFQSSQKLVTRNFGLLLPQYVVKTVSACSPEFPRIEIQIDVHDVEKREIRKGIHR